MPSPIGHTLAAYAALIAMDGRLIQTRHTNSLALGAAFVFGSLADADFVVAHFSTLPYLRHHYFSHSIPFAIALTFVIWLFLKLCRVKLAGKLSVLLGCAYSTHLLLDYLAEDGSHPFGIPLLWPFTDYHFIAPVQTFLSIHRGELTDIFSLHNLLAIGVEFAVMAPIAAIVLWMQLRRKPAAGSF